MQKKPRHSPRRALSSKQSTRTRFELARALPIHLAGEHLNHSVTASSMRRQCANFYLSQLALGSIEWVATQRLRFLAEEEIYTALTYRMEMRSEKLMTETREASKK